MVDSDLDDVVVLNNAAVPAVSPADPSRMGDLVALSALAWVVEAGSVTVPGGRLGHLVAFVLLFEPGSAYDSPNYRWFAARYERFLYVDRVVVGSSVRNRGIGDMVYGAVRDEAARRGAGRVCAEVNLDPPNPGSSRFHRRAGFGSVGSLESSPGHTVEMLVRPVEIVA